MHSDFQISDVLPKVNKKCIYIMDEKNKTNKLQVDRYKPVSWLPTHQGI